jgi:hypothetical protein
MRKLLAFLVFVLFIPFFCFGQDKDSHLKFNEIEINGTVAGIVNKLQEIGYSLLGNISEGGAILKGTFMGDSCELTIVSTEKSKIVYALIINFKTINNWEEIQSKYFSIKKKLMKEYRKPDESKEPCFNEYSYGIKDLQSGKCENSSYWDTYNGKIHLLMKKECNIAIFFTDKNNYRILKKDEKEIENEKYIFMLLESIKDKWDYKDGEIIIQKVLDFEHISKDNIYIYVKEYLTKNYTNIRNIMQIDDKESGLIIIKGVFSETECKEVSNNYPVLYHSVYHTIKYEIKENRMRVTISLDRINKRQPAFEIFGVYQEEMNFITNISSYYPIDDVSPRSFDDDKMREGCVVYKAVIMADATINAIEEFIEKSSKQQNSNDW